MHLKSLIVLDCFTVYRRWLVNSIVEMILSGGNILLRNFPICGRHLICSLFVHQKWTLTIPAPKEKQLQPKTQPDESVYNGIAEQSKWINHILCLPKKNALENNGKSFFFPSLSFATASLAGRYTYSKAAKTKAPARDDDLFITSAREKKYDYHYVSWWNIAPTSYLMP